MIYTSCTPTTRSQDLLEIQLVQIYNRLPTHDQVEYVRLFILIALVVTADRMKVPIRH